VYWVVNPAGMVAIPLRKAGISSRHFKIDLVKLLQEVNSNA